MEPKLCYIRESYFKKNAGLDYRYALIVNDDDDLEMQNEKKIPESQCIFRKNCASVPEERSAIPLETEQSSAS